MKCLVGLFEIDHGRVIFDDKVLSRMSFDEMKLVRQDIGMLVSGLRGLV
jgi:phospholipid/cholesterol/gamma-HCH transport system ATP-binding protein